ncbi:hemin-degrading factor [Aquisalimonas asiatica]|uniref:Putative hemin transport protein n=1 Tax=Aquisalimonas asiatica TaxID=406100 RepID=A0A1H8SXM0_9GAMM|nr:ChuX/HutX family heme-like substrate-binding protein [Aquisalimonas asiatica]SEO83367.1 putative hemin transport protein [Aquisalimonas asiatica]
MTLDIQARTVAHSAAHHHGRGDLANAWQRLRNREPRVRIRNAAHRLGVTELELLLTDPPHRVRMLDPEFQRIYTALSQLGPVMTLARNDQVVHETTGTVGQFTTGSNGNVGFCLGEIDLRAFFRHWAYGVALRDDSASRNRRYSLQFFDRAGAAVHKVFALEETDMAAWHRLVSRFTAVDQRPELEFERPLSRSTDRGGGNVDVEELARDWSALTDIHEFGTVLRRHGICRLHAVELMDGRWCWQLPADSLERLLHAVADTAVPIMAFTANRGLVQIFTGSVHRVRRSGEWINILDERFHLHARTSEIQAIWRVVRPSADGDITSLDCFNAAGDLVLTIFGERRPGHPELPMWRDHMRLLEERYR